MLTWVCIANLSKIFTVVSTVAFRALAVVSILMIGAYSSVLAWSVLAKVDLSFTSSTHPTKFTNTLVVVNKLDALLSTLMCAWV